MEFKVLIEMTVDVPEAMKDESLEDVGRAIEECRDPKWASVVESEINAALGEPGILFAVLSVVEVV